MAVREPGTLTIDNIDFLIARDGRGGMAWTEHTKAQQPPTGTPEEQILNTKPGRYTRPLAFLDWSHGVGASIYRPGDHRIHSSDGPSGELPRTIHRAHNRRKVALTAASGAVTDFFEIGSKLYVVNGGYARQITLTLNAETIAAARPDGVAANGNSTGAYDSGLTFTEVSAPWYDGTSTKVFLGSSADYLVSFDGTTWAKGSGTQAKRTRFALGTYGSGQALWGAPPTTSTSVAVLNLPQGQNPFTAAQWSSALPVSDTGSNCTGMVVHQDAVVVAYDNGQVYAFDTSNGTPSPMVDSKSAIADADSGKNMRVWNGRLFLPMARGLFMWESNDSGTAGVFHPVDPGAMIGNRSSLRGPCTAQTPVDPEWLHAAFYNKRTGDSYVMKGRLPLEGEQAAVRMAWQAACPKIAAKVTAMHITLLGTNPVLCIGTDEPAVYFVTLPRAGNSVFDDPNCQSWLTANSFDTMAHDGLMPSVQKTFWLARLTTKKLTDNEYLNLYSQIDDGDWTLFGSVKDSSEPYEVRFPSGTQGRRIALRPEFVGTDNTIFPTIDAIELEYTPRGAPATWVDVQVYVAQKQLTASGLERLGVADRVAFLRRMASEAVPADARTDDGRTFVAQIDNTVGVDARMVEHYGAHQEPGYLCSFVLNVYDDLTQHSPAQYEISPYTQGTRISYYDTSGS